MIELSVVFIFFSSRRRHTRCSRDWSSDVCSSDLGGGAGMGCEATLHSREAASYFRPMGFWRRLLGGSSAEEINPQRLDYLNEALALERQGDYDAALTSYRLALGGQPPHPPKPQKKAIPFTQSSA